MLSGRSIRFAFCAAHTEKQKVTKILNRSTSHSRKEEGASEHKRERGSEEGKVNLDQKHSTKDQGSICPDDATAAGAVHGASPESTAASNESRRRSVVVDPVLTHSSPNTTPLSPPPLKILHSPTSFCYCSVLNCTAREELAGRNFMKSKSAFLRVLLSVTGVHSASSVQH